MLEFVNGIMLSNNFKFRNDTYFKTLSGGAETAEVSGDISNLDPSLMNFFVNPIDADDTLTLSGVISGSVAIIKIGSGTLVLSGSNTYTGGTTLNGGTLRLLNSAALGTGGVSGSFTTVELGNGISIANAFSLEKVTLATLSGGTETVTISGNITLIDSAFSEDLELKSVDAGDQLTISGNISGTSNINVTGLGTVILSGTNTFSNPQRDVLLQSGTLILQGGSAIPDSGEVVIFNGTLQLDASETIGSLSGSGGVINLTSQTLTINQTRNQTFAGTISGSGGLVKTGSRTLGLSGSNAYSGGTTLNGGGLVLLNSNALGTGALDILGSTVEYGNGVNIFNQINLKADATLKTIEGNVHIAEQSGNIDTSNDASPHTLTVMLGRKNNFGDTEDVLTISGVISGSGDMVVEGPGTLILSATNTYSGGTSFTQEGTVIAENNSVFGSGGLVFDLTPGNEDPGALRLSNGVSLSNTLSLNANGTLGTLSGGTESATFSGAINVQGNTLSIQSPDVADTLTLSGVISGTGNLAIGDINSWGKVTFSGNNTLSGAVSFTGGGTLVLSGSNSFAGGFTSGFGTVILENNLALGSGQVSLNSNGLGNGTLAYSNGINVSKNLTITDGYTLATLTGGTEAAEHSGNIDTGTNGSRATVFNPVDSGDTLTISGVISGTGAVSIGGLGTTIFSGSNTFIGSLALTSGVLTLQGGDAVGDNVNVILRGGTLEVAASETIGTLGATAGTIDLQGTTLTVNQNFNDSYQGNIIGSGSLVKNGNSFLLLNGTNTFTGGTTLNTGFLILRGGSALADNGSVLINGGTFQIDNDETIGSLSGGAGTIQLIANTLTINQDSNNTFGGAIIGNGGSLVKNGSGTLTLSGSSTFTGSTTVNAGTLFVSGSTVSNTNVGAGATLAGTGTVGGLVLDGTVAPGASIGTLTVSSDVVFNSGSSFEVELSDTGAGDLLAVGGSVTINANATVDAQLLPGTFTTGQTYTVLTSTGAITGTFSAVTSNISFIDISLINNANSVQLQLTVNALANIFDEPTYTSGVGIANAFGADGALSFDPSVTVNLTGNATPFNLGTNTIMLFGNGATINGNGFTAVELDSGTLSFENLTVNGLVQVDGGGLILNTDTIFGDLAGAGGTTLNLQSNTLTINGSGSTTFAGAISGSGGLVRAGSGDLTLSGSNTFTGGTTLTSGTLQLSGGSALSDSGALTVNGGTLQLNASEAVGTLSGPGGAVALGSNTLTVNQSSSGTFAGVISGSGGLVKAGSNTLVLSGSNTYTGGTTINGGILRLLNSAGAGSGVITVNGSSIELGNGVNNANAIDMNADTTLATLTGGTEAAEQSGNINTSADSATHVLTASAVDTGDELTISGNISGSGSLIKNGLGTLNLFGVNSYTGGTTINAGIVEVSNGTSIGTGNLNLAGGTLAVQGLVLSNTVTLGNNSTIQTLAAGAQVATLSGTIGLGSNTLTLNTFGGGDDLTLSGNISGSGSLNKSGAGMLTLSGTNTFSGGTTLASGTLVLAGGSALSDSGSLTLNGGALQLNTSETIGAFSGGASAGVALGSNTLTVNQSTSGSFAGIISGSGGLVKQGTKSLTLAGINTFTGGVTISSGFLAAQNNAALGTGDLTLSGGTLVVNNGLVLTNSVSLTADSGIQNISGGTEVSTLSGGITLGTKTLTLNAFDSSDVLTLSGMISGSGSLSKTGSGTLVLSGSNTYTGGTMINGGTLRLLNSAGAGSGVITVNGSSIELGNGVNNANAIDMNADTTLATLTGGTEAAEQSGNINTSADSATHVLTVSAVDAADTLTISDVISGSGSMVKNGSGQLILSGSNTYTGGTTLTSGTLQLSGGSALVDNGAIAINGGTLQLNASEAVGALSGSSGAVTLGSNTLTVNQSNTGSFAGTISGSGGLVKQGTKALTLSGSNTFTGGTTITSGSLVLQGGSALSETGAVSIGSGTLQLASSEAIGNLSGSGNINLGSSTLTVNQNALGTFSGVISGSGAINKAGSGTLVLSGTNTFTGGTTINGGTLRLLNSAGAGSGLITVNGSSIELGNGVNNANAIDMNADTTLATLTGGTEVAEQSGNINTSADASPHTLSVDVVDGADQLTISGVISGSGALVKNGSGQLILSGSNSFSGGATLSAGTLQAANSNAFGTGAVTLSGATLALQNGLNISNNFVGQGSETITTLAGGSEVSTLSGDFDLGSGALSVSVADAGDTLTLSGIVSNSGAFTVNGSGTLILTGSNTFSAGVTLAGSSTTLQAGNNSALGTGGVLFLGGNLAIQNGLTIANDLIFAQSGTIQTMSGGIEVATLSGTIGLGSNTLTLNTFGGGDDLTLSGVISGSGSLSKTGSGTLVLSGNNTFTGGTSVTAGTLDLQGSLAGTTTVGSNGTLIGTGTLDTLVSNGTVAPGNSIGTLNITGDASLNAGSVLDVELDSSGASDLLNVSGTVTVDNGASVNATLLIGQFTEGQTFTVITSGSGIVGTFGSISSSLSFVDLGYQYVGNDVLVEIVAINALATIFDEPTYDTGVGLANASPMDGALEFQPSVTVNLTGDATAFNTGTKTFLLRGNNATVNGNGFNTLQLDSGTLVVEALTLNGSVQLNGGTFGLGTDIAIGDLNGTAPANVDLQSNTLTINQAGSSSFAGTIFGSGAVVKSGSGSLTLSGANTFSGGATLTSGTLALSGGAALSDTGTVTINGGTLQLNANEAVGVLSGSGGSIALGVNTLTVNQNSNGTFAGTISGSGSLMKSGSAVLALSGSNTFSGGITIDGGTLRLLSSGASGTGDISVLGSSIELGDAVNNSANINLSADTTLATLTGGTETAEQSGNIATSADASPHTLTVDTVDGGDSLTISGNISGPGSLVKTGSGAATLSGSNTFSGGATVTSGTLALAGGSALSDSGALAVNGGSLQLNASEAVGTLSGSGGGIALGSNTLTINQGANGTYAGVISGSGSLVKQGSSTLILSGTNTYSGATTISGGTLQANSGSALGTSALDLNGGTLAVNNVTLASGATVSADSTVSTLAGGTEASTLSGAFALGSSTMTANAIDGGDSLTFSGDVSGSGSFEKTGSGTATLSGSNTFTGGTTLTSGTMILAGGVALSDSGVIAVNGGSLQLNASEGIGTLFGSGGGIALGSNTLTVNQDANGTYAGVIAGTGSLVKAGSAVLALSGTNSYTGGTTISGGTLRLLNSTGAGVGTITVNGSSIELGNGVNNANAINMNADTTLGTIAGGTETAEQSGGVDTSADASPHTLNTNAADSSDQLTISGVISGSGLLNNTGQGTVILSNTNTFTGGTTVTSGTLALSGGNALTDSGTVAVNGGSLQLNAGEAVGTLSGSGGGIAVGSNTLTVNQGANGTYAGTISGSGSLVKSGTAILALSGSNTFSGGITINGGTLQLLSSGASGSGDIDVLGSSIELGGGVNNGANINLSVDATLATLAGGSETAEQSGNIDTSTIGTNTLTVNVQDAGDQLNISGVVSGSGDLVKTGSGGLVLSASNTHAGGVDIQDGEVSLENDAAAGTGAISFSGSGDEVLDFGNVTVANTLNLNADGMLKVSSSTATFAGLLNGGSNTLTANTVGTGDTLTFNNGLLNLGTFTKTGNGTVIFLGSDKTITTTNVNAGMLINNANLTTDLNIVNGTSYTGTGTLFGNMILAGTLAPGNSIGTTNVVGDVTFESGSTFSVEVDTAGNSDLLNVTGTTTINGGTLAILPQAGTYGVQTQYTVISSTAGISGAFDAITSGLFFLNPSYQIVGNDVIVTLDLVSVAGFATTPNQQAVASLVDPLLQASPSQDFVDVVNALFTNPGTTGQNLDQLSGEGFGMLTSSTLAANNLRIQGIANHLNDARLCHRNLDQTCDTSGLASYGGSTRYAQANNAQAGPTQSKEWGNGMLWMQGYGGKATMDTGGGKFNVLGIDIGYDHWVSDNVMIGVSAGYSRDQEAGFANLANSEADYINVGVHTAVDFDGAYFTGLLNLGFGDHDTTRNIAFGNINRTATANFNGTTASGYAELGYDGRSGNLKFQPFASLQYASIKRDAFTETGATSIDLVVNKETVNSIQGTLGVSINTLWKGSSGLVIKPEFRTRWVHEFGDAADPRQSVVNFNGSTAPFATITNPAGFSDAVIFGGSFDISRGGSMHIVFGMDYLVSDEYDMWSGSGRLMLNF